MDILIVCILLFGIYYLQRKGLVVTFGHNSNGVRGNYFDILFFVHILFTIVYLIYTLFERSDSGEYYRLASASSNWGEFFESGTPFVKFVCYPFSTILGLSFNAVMLIFSFLGFQGMLLFYLAARENIKQLPLIWGGMSLLEILFILPNSHFWSASLGKGSLMTFAIGLTFYGLSRFNRRLPLILIGAFLVLMIRSHLLLAIVMGLGIGLIVTQTGIKWYFRLLIIAVSYLLFSLLSPAVLENTNTETLNIFESQSIDRRARELGKGGSGVDLANSSQPFKLFTFLFRPLFFDSPVLLGFITSFENIFLIVQCFRLTMNFRLNFRKFNGFHKTAFFSFLFAAVTLSQVSGNLGIAIRQKAQIFPLLYIICAYSASILYEQKKTP